MNFNVSKFEMELIRLIAKRAVAMAAKQGVKYPMMDALMDLEACHCNGCPLDLVKLQAADAFNFSHDVFGIYKHLNRRTGKLEGFFLPRCAMPQKVTA